MASEAPPFWWDKPDWRAYALYPLSRIYSLVATRRMINARREKIDVPVLCVGNFTVGGTGKTPVAIALAKQAKRMHLTPGFLSRGYGGSIRRAACRRPQARQRETGRRRAAASVGPCATATTPNRIAGAKLLMQRGCDFLIMDDGFQSAQIHMDYALVVVDGRYGVGNGHVLPGGPLRAALDRPGALRDRHRAHGRGQGRRSAWSDRRRARAADLRGMDAGAQRRQVRQPAFSGLRRHRPSRQVLRHGDAAGGTIVMSRSFPDHHFYSNEELQELVHTAEGAELELITTAKDLARLRNGSAPQELLDKLNVLEIDAVFENANAARRIIEETLDAWRDRRLKA